MTFDDLGMTFNWVFNGMYLLNHACHDQSVYETHIVSHIWYFSWPHYFDLGWPLKVKSNIIEFLMGCIFLMVHVMTKFYMKHIYEVIYMYMVFQLTSWSLNWITFDLGWSLMVKLGTMEMILSNIWINFTFGKLFTWTGTNNDNIIMTSYRLQKRFWAMFEPI